MNNKYRNSTCQELKHKLKQVVKCAGWLTTKRDHGGLLFIELTDFTSSIQCVVSTDIDRISRIPLESVILVEGLVLERNIDTINQNKENGNIEIQCEKVTVETICEPLPIMPNIEVSEELKLQHRTIYLRGDKMQKILKFRSDFLFFLHAYMQSEGFTLVQTPLITVSSPEGARDFIIPSRLHPGKFYALPQAPQIFKQLLMCGGLPKYYQVAPCFRDEDARSDRCYGEFYQLDFEMSFVEEKDILDFLLKLCEAILKKFSNKLIIQRSVTWKEAMERWGSDKPDWRNPLEIENYTWLFENTEMKLFKDKIKNGMEVFGLPINVEMNKSQREKILEWCDKNYKFKASYITGKEDQLEGPISNFIKLDKTHKIMKELLAGQTIFFVCDFWEKALINLGHLRKYLGELFNLIKDEHQMGVVTDFPMFEQEEGKIQFKHNPFSMVKNYADNLTESVAYQYDLVLNGFEIASGSIREHRKENLLNNFLLCGYEKEEVLTKFKSMFNAFSFGCPPHGGAAPGIDRIIMILLEEPNIREVSAFPMNTNGQDTLCGAPAVIDKEFLDLLKIKTIN